jgi:hypothetical protein
VRARVVASAALAVLVAVVLAGCNFVTPQATLKPYESSDGVSTVIGDVHILNALVLTEDGVSGNLVFTALNTSGDPVDLNVQYESDGEKADLPLKLDPSGSTDFGFGDGGQLFLTAIDSPAGSLLPIYFQYGSEQGHQLRVPVLNGSLGEYYGENLPQTPTPTPTPTETGLPTPSPTETP